MGAPNKRYNESRSYRLVIILYELFALLNLSKHTIERLPHPEPGV